MDEAALQQSLDEVLDQALVYHAFTDYMRDYEMVVYTRRPIPAPGLRLRICGTCSGTSSKRRPRLQGLYPGTKVISGSPRARRWTEAVGIDFHEIRVEASGHNLTLVFAQLEVPQLPLGYTPFVVRNDAQAAD